MVQLLIVCIVVMAFGDTSPVKGLLDEYSLRFCTPLCAGYTILTLRHDNISKILFVLN